MIAAVTGWLKGTPDRDGTLARTQQAAIDIPRPFNG